MQPFWKRIADSPHEVKIREIFGAGAFNKDRFIDRVLILLNFTNRSGSNLLCECLKATNMVANAGESLNWPYVQHIHKIRASKNLSQHLWAVSQSMRHIKGPMVLKASIDQLLMLSKHGYLEPGGVFKSIVYASIERRDVLSQAISFTIAEQTKKWTSEQNGIEVQPYFDGEYIHKLMIGCLHQAMLFKEFAALRGLFVHYFVYEEFVQDKSGCIRRFLESIGIPGAEMDEAVIQLKPQRTETNEIFREQFLRAAQKQYEKYLAKHGKD